MSRNMDSERAREILEMVKERGIPVQVRDRRDIDSRMPGISHQGMVAVAEPFAYAALETVLKRVARSPRKGILVAADHITDEGNLGALIRTAAFFGAEGLILPKDRSAGVTEGVLKRASGACGRLPIVRVVNLARTLDVLEDHAFWIIGAAGDGRSSIYTFDWDRDTVLVLGREDRGLTRLVAERCHEILRIPGAGTVESLNVSVAAGVILSEIFRQRATAPRRLPPAAWEGPEGVPGGNPETGTGEG